MHIGIIKYLAMGYILAIHNQLEPYLYSNTLVLGLDYQLQAPKSNLCIMLTLLS